jgi:glutamate N-acetyltransferase/amino-acid N-acetyltransferase
MSEKLSITSPKGFSASYTAAEIKYKNRPDMAMIFSEAPATYAGAFTKNKVKAAPVLWDENLLNQNSKISAVVINAGVANAATGAEGLQDAEETADYTAKKLSVDKTNVLVASTGVIGMRLPLDKLKNGIDAMTKTLSNDVEIGHLASKAIMTTDTVEKEAAASFEIAGKQVTVAGMCKGSGMIHPNMGTMLSFITTDVNIDKALLQKALSEIVDDTYNMISVDGDTSTNDSCIVLANAMAGNDLINKEDENYEKFKKALFEVNSSLSKQIAKDGEGATKLMEVIINGASTKLDAKKIAKSVVTSNLTKAAIYGMDPNWGRIICAIGYAEADFEENKVDISFESEFGKITLCENGRETNFDEEKAKKIMSTDHIKIICDLKCGDYNATAYGCDLTHKYVDINASYRS